MIVIIGGSGFYNFLDSTVTKEIETPFGKVRYESGQVDGVDVCFIPRHGSDHSVLPSQINYRANIFAAHKLGVEYILATNAVGSLREKITPGMFSVPDHIMDFTKTRISTFFDGSDFEVITKSGKTLKGVVHTDVTEIFTPSVRKRLLMAGESLGYEMQDGGTLVVTEGPRFESPAEIKAYGLMGADYVGMTSAPEVFLAKEMEIPYATMAIITNYAAGLQKSVSVDEVFALYKKRMKDVKDIMRSAIVD